MKPYQSVPDESHRRDATAPADDAAASVRGRPVDSTAARGRPISCSVVRPQRPALCLEPHELLVQAHELVVGPVGPEPLEPPE